MSKQKKQENLSHFKAKVEGFQEKPGTDSIQNTDQKEDTQPSRRKVQLRDLVMAEAINLARGKTKSVFKLTEYAKEYEKLDAQTQSQAQA